MTRQPEDLTRDDFIDGRLRIWQPRIGYRAATDPVFLAACVPARPGERVLELGCGVGVASLCLALRVANLDLHGIELQPPYAALARRNAVENDIGLSVHDGDLLQMPALLRRMNFHHVLANPPFERASASRSADSGRDIAHREGAADLASWIAVALKRLRPSGSLTLIQKSERLAEILGALQGRAGAIEVLPLASRLNSPAGRVIVRARKGRSSPLVLHAPLVVHAGDSHQDGADGYSAAAKGVLRSGEGLLVHAS